MTQAIREEFRAYAHEKDPKRIEMKIGEARGGLERLKVYSGMKTARKEGKSTFTLWVLCVECWWLIPKLGMFQHHQGYKYVHTPNKEQTLDKN